MGKRRLERQISAGGVVFRKVDGAPQFLLILDGHGSWGFPKGHIEAREVPLATARREIAEETGLDDLIFRGELEVTDVYSRQRRGLIRKFCHLFLFESPAGQTRPQLDEGITQCRWYPADLAVTTLAYENARRVLRKAADVAHAMCQQEAARSGPP